MSNYYLGGYYLVHLNPVDFGSQQGNLLYTCSTCINTSLLNIGSFGWVTNDHKYDLKRDTETKQLLQVDDLELTRIREWINENFEHGNLDSSGLFYNLETVTKYRELFLPHLSNAKTIALYFDKKNSQALIDTCIDENYGYGEFGLRKNLLCQIPMDDNAEGEVIGHDLIGIDFYGSFHSFHCYDAGQDLSEKFGVRTNEFGLLENPYSWEALLAYANDSSLSGFTSVPWLCTQLKLIDNLQAN